MAETSGAHDLSTLDKDPRLFLYTSLTAGSSHIITATSRMETILKANRIPFLAVDTATDEKARRLWGRRARGKKLPGLVKEGFVLGDLEQVEEWNEFGELKEALGPCPPTNTSAAKPSSATPAPPLPVKSTATSGTANVSTAKPTPAADESAPRALPGAAEIAARNNPLPKSSPEDAVKPEGMGSSVAEKEESLKAADEAKEAKGVDHLSAPPSAIPSGTATPTPTTGEGVGGDATAEGGERHRGSDVVVAPGEEVKKVESETAIQEEDGSEGVAKGVEAMQVGEGKRVGEQGAKVAEDAGKSVED